MANFLNTARKTTSRSSIKVDAGLPPGRHVFQLTVVDEQGNKSKVAKISVEVVRRLVVTDPRLADPIVVGPRIRDPIRPVPIRPTGFQPN